MLKQARNMIEFLSANDSKLTAEQPFEKDLSCPVLFMRSVLFSCRRSLSEFLRPLHIIKFINCNFTKISGNWVNIIATFNTASLFSEKENKGG